MRKSINHRLYSYRLLIPLLLTLVPFPVFSQSKISYECRFIAQRDGLINNNVFDIRQDSRGFIWLATGGGLQRFDGTRFINYRDILNDPTQLVASGGLLAIEPENNRLWVIKPGKVERLDILKNSFATYGNTEEYLKTGTRLDTLSGLGGRKWLFDKHAFFSLDSRNHSTFLYDFSDTEPFSKRSGLVVRDQEGNPSWLADYVHGMLQVDMQKKIVLSANDAESNSLVKRINKQLTNDNAHARRIMVDSRGNFWISTWDEKFYQVDVEGNLHRYSLNDLVVGNIEEKEAPYSVTNVFEDNHQQVWITTEYAGLLRYDKVNDKFEQVNTGNRERDAGQFNYEIFSIFQDKNENIWLGTDKGITIFNPYRQGFKSIHHEKGNALSLPNNEIQCITQIANGNILIGTWGGGISVFDSAWKFIRTIHFEGPKEVNYIWSFVQDRSGIVWAGCQHGYIQQYDPATGKVRSLNPPELENSTIRAMTIDKYGTIWMGLNSGKIAEWAMSTNRFHLYQDNDPIAGGSTALITQIFIDNQDQCWVATTVGLRLFDLREKKYKKNFIPVSGDASSIPARSIEGIAAFDDKSLAVATIYGGLNLLDLSTQKFSLLKGVKSNSIHSMRMNDDGRFWFTSDYDIHYYNSKTKEYSLLDLSGEVNSNFKSGGFYRLQNGNWVTATETEVISFDPSVNVSNDSVPRVAIAAVSINDAAVFVDSLMAEGKSLSLDYKQNFISIDYAIPNCFQQRPRYYYKLTGVNKEWVEAGSNLSASYTNLAPGHYTFSVRAEYGEQPGEETFFSFVIHPPFWKTWWFIAIVSLLALLLVVLLLRRRISVIKTDANLRQQMAETEMMALKAQMNPHFIFNCITAIDNLIHTDQKEKATTYLNRFAKMIRAILDSSRNNVVPIQKDLETLQLYLQLEQFRFSNMFDYHIDVEPGLIQSDIKVPPMILQPFVENAIHHGLMNKTEGDRKMNIRIWIENDFLRYRITDNGVGRERAAAIKKANKPEQVSHGMNIASRRIEMHNADINRRGMEITDVIENGEVAGTRVDLWLTLK
jgi:ligand-binding sensor domain-containing protein